MIDFEVADHETAAVDKDHAGAGRPLGLDVVEAQRDRARGTGACQIALHRHRPRLGLGHRAHRAHLLARFFGTDFLDPLAAHRFEHVEEPAYIVADIMFGIGHCVLSHMRFFLGLSVFAALFHAAFLA